MDAARRREIDIVLVWRLDRWGRSLPDLVTTLQELNHLGVGFVPLTEALDPTTPTGRAVDGLLPSLLPSNMKFCESVSAPGSPMPGRTAKG
jgi:DNA invertase Pin-like site-specific DNA recombinase